MNFKEILELIDKIADRDIGAVEIEQAGTKIRIEAKQQQTRADAAQPHDAPPRVPPVSSVPASGSSAGAHAVLPVQTEESADEGLHVVTSPIVGTFYRSPNPEADPFVHVGDQVSKGKVVCIIEAMKLMNEIESDVDGVIVKIYPQNGQPIEYGEKLFAVRV